jgi:hypothetical protein
MSALLAEQRHRFAELNFQETRPSFQRPQEARLPPTVTWWRAAPPPADAVEATEHPLRLYHDLTTAAWLDEDAAEPEAAFDAVDRQSWALARLVCGTALAVAALGLASFLVG